MQDDLAFQAKQKAEQAAMKKMAEAAKGKGPFGGTGLKKS